MLVTTSPGGWVAGGWTKTKLMLFSTQVVVELKLELSLAKAGAELCQAQVKLEVVVEFGVEVEACPY